MPLCYHRVLTIRGLYSGRFFSFSLTANLQDVNTMPKSKSKSAGSSRPSGQGAAPYSIAANPTKKAKPSSSSNQRNTSSGLNLIAPNTSLGQHFLKNPAVINSIVQKADIRPTDVVLEIGPGTGNLTMPMLERAKQVIAMEYDPRMIRELLKRVEHTSVESKLHVIQGDAIRTPFPYFDVCVANVPYQISSPLVFKLLEHRPMFRCAVLMFQEEFALRLTARPGETLYGRLSVNTQLLAKVDQLLKVGKNNFRPPPQVESRVVRIELRNPPPPVNFTEWDGMIRLIFNRKNKTLRSVLMTKSTIKLLQDNRQTHQSLLSASSSALVDAAAEARKMDEDDEPVTNNMAELIDQVVGPDTKYAGLRASKMSIEDLLELLTEFHDRGIHFA